MCPWVGSDYSRCTKKQLLEEYENITEEILKRFKKQRKSKK